MSVTSVLRIVMALVDTAVYAKEKYDAVRAKVGVMAEEDREPTKAEWAALDAETKTVHERIQAS